MSTSHLVLGIDIGGSGIKGAPVDLATGELAAERKRIETPEPASPQAMLEVIREIIVSFDWKGDVGCGFPGVIKNGEVRTAANLDPAWIGINILRELQAMTEGEAGVMNDADAAGIAEMEFGSGRDRNREGGGSVMMITLGTGIGTAMFVDGVLVPNLELGHIEIRGEIAEKRASGNARKAEGLSWKKWGKRLDRYLKTIERLTNPDLFIIGGGVSSKSEKYFEFLDLNAEITTAQMLNEAGIIGAAMTVPSMRKRHLL